MECRHQERALHKPLYIEKKRTRRVHFHSRNGRMCVANVLEGSVTLQVRVTADVVAFFALSSRCSQAPRPQPNAGHLRC